MKVCFISARLYPLSVSTGIGTVVTQVSQQLMCRGHEVLVITTTPDRSRGLFSEEIGGAKVYSFHPLNIYERHNQIKVNIVKRTIYNGIDLLWNPQIYKIIKKILAQEKPDIVHVHNWRGFSDSLFDAIKSLGLPLVLTAHDYFLVCPKASLLRSSGEICTNQPPVCRLYKTIRKLAVGNKPDAVTAPSQFVIDKLREHGFFQDIKTVRLPNTIGLDDSHYPEKNYDAINILYVGVLTMSKGVHILINAFKQLNYKNIKLHIVGGGQDTERLKRMTETDSRIIFHGFMPKEELISFYKKAHITVVPSIWYEPFGMIIIESFKYGTPVVASNIGGIPEIIENGYNGLLFEPGNIGELKDTLAGLIESPSELRRLSEGAFESVKKYDIAEYIVKLQEIYEQVRG